MPAAQPGHLRMFCTAGIRGMQLGQLPLQQGPQVRDHGWSMHAGTFDTKEEAVIAYNAGVIALGQGHELHQVKQSAECAAAI